MDGIFCDIQPLTDTVTTYSMTISFLKSSDNISHTGARLEKGLFKLFNVLNMAKRISPGTVDNASNNISEAEHLADSLLGVLYIDMPVSELMRCICVVSVSSLAV